MDPKANIPYPILPVEPGSLLGLVVPEALSPAQAPSPALQASNVADPPLPEVVKKSDTSPPPSSSSSDSTDSGSKSTPAPGSPEKSSAFANAANLCLPLVAIVVLALLAN